MINVRAQDSQLTFPFSGLVLSGRMKIAVLILQNRYLFITSHEFSVVGSSEAKNPAELRPPLSCVIGDMTPGPKGPFCVLKDIEVLCQRPREAIVVRVNWTGKF